jgi:hypothetical protein
VHPYSKFISCFEANYDEDMGKQAPCLRGLGVRRSEKARIGMCV